MFGVNTPVYNVAGVTNKVLHCMRRLSITPKDDAVPPGVRVKNTIEATGKKIDESSIRQTQTQRKQGDRIKLL